MSNAEYEIIVHALDAARLKLGLDLLTPDVAADRIRLLINLTVKSSAAAVFAAAATTYAPVLLDRSAPLSPGARREDAPPAPGFRFIRFGQPIEPRPEQATRKG